MIPRYMRLASTLLLGLLLAGCYTDYGPVEVGSAPDFRRPRGWPRVMQPGEKIKITVYGEEALTGDYDINPSGYVSMPLIGQIKAAGHAAADFERDDCGSISRWRISAGSPRECRHRQLQTILRAWARQLLRASIPTGADLTCIRRSPWREDLPTGLADPTSS